MRARRLNGGLFLTALMLLGSGFSSLAQPNGSKYEDVPEVTDAQREERCDAGWDRGWCWGEDKSATLEKWTLFSDVYKAGLRYEKESRKLKGAEKKDAIAKMVERYTKAIEPLEWLLENRPQLHEAVFIYGIGAYEGLADHAADKDAKAKYQTRALDLYDSRIEYYGGKADLFERKANNAFGYYVKDASKHNMLFDLLREAVWLKGNDASRGAIIRFMNMAYVRAAKEVNAGIQAQKEEKEYVSEYDKDAFFADYDKLIEIIEYNTENGDKREAAKWTDLKDKVDGLLCKVFECNCDYVYENMTEQIAEEPDNMKVQKKALKFMLNGGCHTDPLASQVMQNIFQAEPTSGLASTIAKNQLSYGKDTLDADSDAADAYFTAAIEWMGKAIETLDEEDLSKKAELQLDIARVLSIQGKYSESRKYALESVETDAGMAAEAYSHIGNLYMNSYKMCTGANDVESRACFLAAYDMYARAGDKKGMGRAQAQFPGIEIIFTLGKKEGDSINVGCWIGGSTTIRKRPQ